MIGRWKSKRQRDDAKAIGNRDGAEEPLERRLRQIDRRLAEIEMLRPTLGLGTYRRQEIEIEERDLRTARRVTDLKLQRLRYNDEPSEPERAERERRARLVEGAARDRRESLMVWIAKLEAQGEFQQARIWRGELLDLQATVEKELGL